MIRFYMDENVHGAITRGLRQRGIDVVTAQGDIAAGTPDDMVLDRAVTLDRVLFSQDDDLLREATRRQQASLPFPGVVFAAQANVSVGRCIEDLALIALAGRPEEFANSVCFLPLT